MEIKTIKTDKELQEVYQKLRQNFSTTWKQFGDNMVLIEFPWYGINNKSIQPIFNKAVWKIINNARWKIEKKIEKNDTLDAPSGRKIIIETNLIMALSMWDNLPQGMCQILW